MRVTSSVLCMVALSTGVLGHVPAPSPVSSTTEPCESDLSSSIPSSTPQSKNQQMTTTVIAYSPSPSPIVDSQSSPSVGSWSPSNSFYVAPLPLPSTPSGPLSSPVVTKSGSSAATGQTTPASAAISPSSSSIVSLPASSSGNDWSPSNSFYVVPVPLSSSIGQPSVSTPSAIYGSPTPPVAASSQASASPAATSGAPLPGSSSVVEWSPSNSFYVVPVPLSSSIGQPSVSTPSAIYGSPTPPVAASSQASASPAATSGAPLPGSSSVAAWSQSNSFYVVPLPISSGSLASSPSTIALSAVETLPFIPGVIPSSTPGVVASFTPGIVLSLTPDVIPPPQSSASAVPSSNGQPVLPSQVPSSGVAASLTAATTPGASTSVPAPSSAPAASSILPSSGSVASSLGSAASSAVSADSSIASAPLSDSSAPSTTFIPINTASFSRASAYTPLSATPSSSRRPSASSARSTLSTTAVPSSSFSAQGTGIPPAPSAAGASGNISARGKERVWWVAFLVDVGSVTVYNLAEDGVTARYSSRVMTMPGFDRIL
ncbi:hypothetical protein EK21DRAFT_83894 [Setomelanomma holmii]|uniref:Uncharacterized protein n=1 Tax=Setomelanomma holmii TaxID=210430 RepID=A0A9P4HMC6_9PLEO|nr:hypothetical protein EK21DRAFT_83894 [Setomelanomma holmii]